MSARACLILALATAVLGAVARLATPVAPVDAEYRSVVAAYLSAPHH